MVFSGSFDIEDGDFSLHAKRFILRENEISFAFNGCDEYGKFIVEGVAVKTEHGFFMAPRHGVKYSTYDSDDIASIKIESISLTEKKTGSTRKRVG